MDSPIDLDILGPICLVKDMNCWTIYAEDLFIVVNVKYQPHFLNKLITEEWYTSVSQILLNNTHQVLNSEFFPSPRLVTPPNLANPIYPTYS